MTKREKQISRITQMESILSELNEGNRKLSDALDTFCGIQAKVKKLGDYIMAAKPGVRIIPTMN